VLEQAILDLQIIERSVAAKTLPNLEIRLALRRCLRELRTLAAGSPRRHDEQADPTTPETKKSNPDPAAKRVK